MMEYKAVELIVDEDLINANDIMKIIEPLWWSVSIHEGEEKYIKDLSNFSEEQKYILAIEWYIAEVNNGGHDQFFFNSTGIVWEDALKGFEIIGSKEYYEILKESTLRLGGFPSKDRFTRQDQLDEYEADFDDLDEKLYNSEEDYFGLVMNYIRTNANKFLFRGYVNIPE
ncbi:DMP19 family protein [Paenibacillus sp. YYML68]|uniref:DMP19 family protein n=1 Tax=Paenibacillus sp. YYML68 TaxID=2909250 RepID=UPI0024914AE6|nr:DMP19 family protein [Paenibacillus sp. YYML68]